MSAKILDQYLAQLLSAGVTCDLCQGLNLKCEVVTFRRMSWDPNQINNKLRWLCWDCQVVDYLNKYQEKVCVAPNLIIV